MAYINPAQLLAPYLQPLSRTAVSLFPTVLEQQRLRPLTAAQTALTQERLKELQDVRNLYNRMMGGVGRALPQGMTPEKALQNSLIRSRLKLPQLQYDTFTIHGPQGETKRVAVPKGTQYSPPEGWSLTAPRKLERKTRTYIDEATGRKMVQEYDFDPITRKEIPVGKPYISQTEPRRKMEWWSADGEKFSDYFTEEEWGKVQDIIRKSGGKFEKPELTAQKRNKRINDLLDQRSKIERAKITIRQRGVLDAFAASLGQAAGLSSVQEGASVTPEMINAYEEQLDLQLSNIQRELKELGYEEQKKADKEEEAVSEYIRKKLGAQP